MEAVEAVEAVHCQILIRRPSANLRTVWESVGSGFDGVLCAIETRTSFLFPECAE
jgi:hypothetical protein